MKTRTELYKTYEKYERSAAQKIDSVFMAFQKIDRLPDMCPYCNNHPDSTNCPIMDAPFYVLSNDPFFGNNELESKTNTVVVPCASWEEAQKIVDYIESRKDQKYIRIVIHKPKPNRSRYLSQIINWRYLGLKVKKPCSKQWGKYTGYTEKTVSNG